MEDAIKTHDDLAYKVSSKERKRILENIKPNLHKYWINGCWVCPDEYSMGLMGLIRPLQKMFGGENLVGLLKSIDFKACQQITDSEDIAKLFVHPENIPGIKKHVEEKTT